MIYDSIVLKLLRAINSSASADSVFRIFALEIESLIKVWTIQGYIFDKEGSLVLSDWFGISDESLVGYRKIGSHVESPLNVCKEKLEILIFSKSDIIKDFPSSRNWPFIPESIVTIPMFCGESNVGILGFSFKEDFSISAFSKEKPDETTIIVWLATMVEIYSMLILGKERFKNLYYNPQEFQLSKESLKGPKLSPRHYEILTYMGQGLTNRSIAVRMKCSESSIRTEIGKIFAVMGVVSRAQATALAHKYFNPSPHSNRPDAQPSNQSDSEL